MYSNSDANPSRWNAVFVLVLLVEAVVKVIVVCTSGLTVLARWQPYPRPWGDVVSKLAAASHVHLQNHHA